MTESTSSRENIIQESLQSLLCAASMLKNVSRQFFRNRSTTGVQFNILMLLKYADHPMTQKELSERLLVDKSNLTGLVDRMSSAGHLQRVKSPEDRRSFRLQLTPEAEALLEELERPYLELLHSILGDFSEDELLTLLRTMNKLQRALDNRCAFAAANLSDNDN
jgi:DNA-binding MarR family transcriptional regulator